LTLYVAEDSAYRGSNTSVVEYPAYHKDRKKKILRRYQYILGMGGMDVFCADGAAGI